MTVARVVAVVGLLAAGCTSSGGTSSRSTQEPTSAPTTVPTTSTTSAVEASPTTTEPVTAAINLLSLTRQELLDLWAADRAAAVERIVEGGWGVRDNVLFGPSGLTFDLARCPEGWSNDGPADEGVVLGWWDAVHYGSGPSSANAYLAWLGAEATVAGQPITLEASWPEVYEGDFHRDPATSDAQENANRELVADISDEVLAVVGFREWSQNDGLRAHFDAACLPSLGVLSNQAAEASPWWSPSLGLQVETEVVGWARYLQEQFGDESAAVLVMDIEFGDRYLDSFSAALGSAATDRLVVQRHRPDVVGIDPQLAAIVEADVDVLFLATAGSLCPQAITSLRNAGSNIPVVLPSICAGYGLLGPVFDQEGLWTIAGTYHSGVEDIANSTLGTHAARNTEPGQRWFADDRDWLRTWQAVEIVKIADQLPGGLTRTNLALAAWSFHGRHPYAEHDITVEWAVDDIAIEQLRLLRFNPSTRLWEFTTHTYDGGR
ncbi:MAG: ABC transporter substrate-binding protein [Actinomycetota bacterium]|nr:ABC transporter substrate-binding protein [Actinomycetota bacterium]